MADDGLKREIVHLDISKPEEKDKWLDMRAGDLTSTDISALFRGADGRGQNPYRTHYELWHEKRLGERLVIEESERMKWGRRLERAIAKGVAKDMGWETRAWNAYQRIPELRLGSSFDYRIIGEPKAVLEIKCVDYWVYKKVWIEHPDGSVEPPPHIEWQLQHEMLVAGYDEAYLVALVSGNHVNITHHVANPDMRAAILREADAFWQSIEDDVEPDPEYTRDLKSLTRNYVGGGEGFLGTEDQMSRLQVLASAYADRRDRSKVYKDDMDTIKAEFIHILGDAEWVSLPGFKKATCKYNKTKTRRPLLVERQEEEPTDG
jgi:putative phage-type endonuclease